jgi:hypothetical protein
MPKALFVGIGERKVEGDPASNSLGFGIKIAGPKACSINIWLKMTEMDTLIVYRLCQIKNLQNN